jgi:hypothetical protein
MGPRVPFERSPNRGYPKHPRIRVAQWYAFRGPDGGIKSTRQNFDFALKRSYLPNPISATITFCSAARMAVWIRRRGDQRPTESLEAL